MDNTLRTRNSISTRLTSVVTGILVTAVLVSGGLGVFEQQRQLNHALKTKATSLVQFMAEVTPLSILSLNFVEMNNNVKKVVLTDEDAVYAIILNEQGIPLVHFFKDADPLVTDQVRELAETRQSLSAAEALKQTGHILEIAAPILSGEKRIGTAILGLSLDQMRNALLIHVTTIVITLILVIGLSIVLLRLVLRQILHPIQALTTAAIQISTGDLQVELTGTDRTDELGILASAFESMADQLRGLIAGLERHLAELKRTSQALQESEERFRAAFENANVGVCLVATSGHLVKVNEAMCQMFGYDHQELEQMNINSIAYPDDLETSPTFIKSAIAGETNQANFDKRYIHKQGHIIWGHVSTSLIRDAQGEPVYFISHVQDVTAQKQAESALRESEERYHTLFAHAPDAIFLENEEDEILDANPAACTLLGYSREELLAMHVSDLQAPELRGQLGTVIRNELSWHGSLPFESVDLRRDGTRVAVEITTSRMGDSKLALAIVRDITERKKAETQLLASEQLFRALVENSPDFIARYDREFRRIYVNPAIQKLFKGSAESVLGTTPVDHSPVYAPQVYVDHLRQVLETATENSMEMPYRTVQGEMRWGHMRFVPEFSPDGKVDSVLAIGRDITERKRAEAEINKLNQELEQRVRDRTAQLEAANHELEAFAYSVSHDLRAPLRHIDGFIELLQNSTGALLDEKGQHYMAMIADSAGQMGKLIDDLLSFSRMGRNEMITGQVDLAVLVDEVIRELSTEIEGRNVEWNIARLPRVRGDRSMLKIVITNLISNALKFTRPRKAARIEIGHERGYETEIVIFIRDNGVGFDMKYADKLFAVFQRLHRQEDFEGTGIGLANVRRIINRHGGRTWAEGKVDHGARFYVSLPQSIQKQLLVKEAKPEATAS